MDKTWYVAYTWPAENLGVMKGSWNLVSLWKIDTEKASKLCRSFKRFRSYSQRANGCPVSKQGKL